MKEKTGTQTDRDLAARVRDMEMNLEHVLFLLRVYRQLRICDRCADLAYNAPVLGEEFNEEGEEE